MEMENVKIQKELSGIQPMVDEAKKAVGSI